MVLFEIILNLCKNLLEKKAKGQQQEGDIFAFFVS